MSRSTNSSLSIVAGSLAVAGAVAAASMWSNFRHQSQASDKNDALDKSPRLSRSDSEKLKQVVNASMKFVYNELPAHIVGDRKVRKRTSTEREDLVHKMINLFFNHFYMVKGDRSVSSDNTEETEDMSVNSARESLSGMEVVEQKVINYEWDDEEYIEEKKAKPTPVSGSDAAALFLTGALVAAQALAC